MQKKLYVGNLAYSTTEEELSEAFRAFGEVATAKVVTDRETGRPRGFAFVEMVDETGAKAAIEGLHETQLGGRTIQVSEARPPKERTGGFHRNERGGEPRDSGERGDRGHVDRGDRSRGDRSDRFDRRERRPRYDRD